MKNFLSGLLIAGALLLAGCSGVLDESAQPASSGTTGTVLVQIGSPAAARTLAPEADGIKAYIVKYAKASFDENGDIIPDAAGSGPWTEVDVANVSHEATVNSTKIELEPATWVFEAIGYANEAKTEAVATGFTTVTVEKGKVATAAILLSKGGDTNVPGYFKYNVDWTDLENVHWENGNSNYIGVSELTLKLSRNKDISGFDNVGDFTRDLLHDINTATSPHTSVIGTIELPSGVYDMEIKMVVGNRSNAAIDSESTVAYRTEVVYIYSYLTTETPPYTFTDLDIQKLHLTGPIPWATVNGIHTEYVAQSFELYTSIPGGGSNTIIPFSYTNDGATTETSFDLTGVDLENGTWEVYIPGYLVSSNGSVTSGTGNDTIAMKTVYLGITDPEWKTLPIETKQGSVYDHYDDRYAFNDSENQDSLDASGRRYRVVTDIPGSTPGISAPLLQDGDYGWFNATQSALAAGMGVITPNAIVRAYIGTDYKVSYIEIEEKRDYWDGKGPVRSIVNPDPTFNGDPTYNPTLNSYSDPSWQTLSFAMPPMSTSDYTVPPSDAVVTVTVHYFHTGDVLHGSYIGAGSNDYMIAYVNSGAEHASGNMSITVLDAADITRNTTAVEAYTTRSADFRGFALTTIDELGKVLSQDRINASRFIRTSPACYWAAINPNEGYQGWYRTINIYRRTGTSGSYSYNPVEFQAYVYKDNSILENRDARAIGQYLGSYMTSWNASLDPRSDYFRVAVSGGGIYYNSSSTVNISYGEITLIDSYSDTGYEQRVKTVTIP
jgi:hypothetical protein